MPDRWPLIRCFSTSMAPTIFSAATVVRDDNFYLYRGSPAIDRGDSWAGPVSDTYGASRHDDPATVDAGSSDYYEQPSAITVFPPGAPGYRDELACRRPSLDAHVAIRFPVLWHQLHKCQRILQRAVALCRG